jgi:hypothetical protein
LTGGSCNFSYGTVKGRFIGAGWGAIAADLADELHGSSFNLLIGRETIGLAELLDVSAHAQRSCESVNQWSKRNNGRGVALIC